MYHESRQPDESAVSLTEVCASPVAPQSVTRLPSLLPSSPSHNGPPSRLRPSRTLQEAKTHANRIGVPQANDDDSHSNADDDSHPPFTSRASQPFGSSTAASPPPPLERPWAAARALDAAKVHKWWYCCRGRAKKLGIELPEGSYEMSDVGDVEAEEEEEQEERKAREERGEKARRRRVRV
ncbi:hypothetical protein DFP72DRAFT_1170635 [Ephemerocybe angulata]|uniref:Uncharacterized protein n=1 Tax=Ephemerocybe angulata TaxID=980116 RepID=A0A8H6HVA5_9AGAR|nr:hypothetical protein DFP72DRAFT_1170635 [Tulosesus angulatus]